MPSPQWMGGDYDPMETPDVGSELIGRGRKSRSTKTNIPDLEGATILQRIGNVPKDLADIFQKLHAHHYTRTRTIKHEDGRVEIVTEPDVLGYEELKKLYPAIRMWEEAHQGQVEHMASHKGWAGQLAAGKHEVPREKDGRQQESSAGADKSAGTRKSRWQ